MFLFSLSLIVFSCKKEDKNTYTNDKSLLIKADSTNYYSEAKGNQLIELDSINRNTMELIHYSVGKLFIDQGRNGLLKKLINQSTCLLYTSRCV